MRFTAICALVTGLLLAGTAGAQEYIDLAPQVKVLTASGGSYLGVGVADINSDRVKALKLKEERGVEITRVEEDSPAAMAGLKVGDVVLEYNGERIEGTEQFVRMVRETPDGRQVRLQISREGAIQNLNATIGVRKGGNVFVGQPFDTEKFRAQMDKLQQELRNMPDVPQPNIFWRSGTLGVIAEPLEGQLADYFGVKDGVLVRSVTKDSAAEKAGIKAGDVITKVDDAKVTTPREITSAIRKLGAKNTFPVTLLRNHKEMTVTATLEKREAPQRPPAPPVPPRPARDTRL